MSFFRKFLELEGPRIRYLIATLTGVATFFAIAFPESNLIRGLGFAGLALLVSYIVISLGRQLADELFPRIIQRFPEQAEQAYLYSAGRYGMGHESLDVECVIKRDGGALVKRIVKLKAHSTLEKLESYLLVPDHNSEQNIGLESVRSLTPDRDITPKTTPKQGRLLTELTITPRLNEDEGITYEMKERLPIGLYDIGLTPEELRNKEEYNYFGWNIQRPTRRLILHVYFPEDCKPNFYETEVRFASTSGAADWAQQKEQKNISKPEMLGPAGGQYELRLEVEHPMIGLVYILRWRPLPKQA